ncbi:Tetratricopeptide repeat-containing protein (plasmid) [Gemmatirosa kalamazoonensis]|uniref:Tetratricopeptide repeat-containing protein n=1 Tax=Gemmatirosa kalamazoonensis TaxID=861299 RepID=W0RSG5_9BACT|nr:tetratricopeptide repeat protein [Gemmatirosa kalamazoonensis]AHG92533.1 Tetratricopeptide repeat-containing protein [Gemmatirosa kalamazoonensis]
MLPRLLPTAALRADLDTTDAPDEASARWLVVATVLARLGQVDAADRAGYAHGCAEAVEPMARELLAWRGPAAPDALAGLVQREVEAMERAAALHLALSALQSLVPLLADDALVRRGHVLAQLGRVARQMGELDAATRYYESARDLAARAHDDELAARAAVGLGVVHGQRGNYPAARDAYRRALAAAPAGSPIARGAHHGLMLAATAAEDYDAAFEHGWQAFVHAHDDAEGRAEMLINLARLCRKVGEYAAALRAFQASLGLTTVRRLQLPALGGAVLAASALGDHATADALSAVAERLAAAGEPAYERACAWIDLASGALTRGARGAAERYVHTARAITIPAGFHELTWQTDDMANALAAAPREHRPTRARTVAPPPPLGAPSSAVIAEIRALPVDDATVDALVGT